MCTTTSHAGAHAAVVGELFLLQPVVPHLSPAQRRIKRLVDVTGSLFALIVVAPLMVLVTVLVGLTTAGPILVEEICVGACGRKFSRYRFRTTATQGETDAGSERPPKQDLNPTRIGRFLRTTSIDELPELFNVLSGEMSLIGPRPEPRHVVRLYRDRFPAYELRLTVKPGMIGLAQTACRHSAEPELRLHYDLKYVYQCSLATDMSILLRTLLPFLPLRRAKAAEPGLDIAQIRAGIEGRLRARFID
jgi:lipopolysaccharide/colanic/teichoic acid biosynthesis glycosyltransferase